MAGRGSIRSTAAALAALMVASAVGSAPPADRDWSATLRRDAQALHDEVAANHPGSVNPADPGFARRNDAQLKRALARARTARSYGDYYFTLREYVASFDDGHFSFGATGATPNIDRWPGFLTEDDGSGAPRVYTVSEGAPVPVGAHLLSCDGRSAAAFAADTLGRSWGRWQLEAQRLDFGRFLLIDQGNRYVRMPARCTFRVGAERRTVTLAWRPLSFAQASALLVDSGPRPVFASRTLADGIRWYAIPSFNGAPQSNAGKALPPMIAAMRADRAALGVAPAVVLDLRGNGGGSSDWSRQIAVVLWGEAAVETAPEPKMTVGWRASPANLATIELGYAERGDRASPELGHWFIRTIAGLKGAIARGQPLWTAPDDSDEPTPVAGPITAPPPLAGPVYVLTDSDCASACLDAVDLWTALGAIQIGRVTSADTLYMELRSYRLPSGLTGGGMPMKVYAGRKRGSNEPAVPRFRYDGDMNDIAALERWIATLPAA